MLSYNPINVLGIGLGNPIEYSTINAEDSVLHLGSGFGDDTFAIRRIVGDNGRVIGIDHSIDNIAISRQNCGNFGYNNVTFFLRQIDKLLFDANSFDVVVCNYALNMLLNRDSILNEIRRILKVNGKLVISDFLVNKTIPEVINDNICSKYQQIIKYEPTNLPKILTDNEYKTLLNNHKFSDIKINIERIISIENGELLLYIDNDYVYDWNKIKMELTKIISSAVLE